MLACPRVCLDVELYRQLPKRELDFAYRLNLFTILNRVGGILPEPDVLDQIYIACSSPLIGHHAGENQLTVPSIDFLAS